MQSIPSTPRAAGARLLLLLVLLALVGAVVLLLASRAGDPPLAAAPGDGALERTREGEAELSLPTPEGAADGGASSSLPIPARVGIGVGVRLAGPGRLVGHVLERDGGAGLANARVQLLALPPVGVGVIGRVLSLASMGEGLTRRALPVAVVATAEGGRFEFEGVREGIYYVDVQSPYHVSESAVQARVLASGDGGPVDLFVRAGGRVVGQVLQDERPVPGAKVALEPGPGLFIESARRGSWRILEGKTDEEGRFEFSGVAPGEGYEVTAMGRGIAITHAQDVVVRAGADTELLITARIGGTVTGRVLSMALTEDEDAEPMPLAGAQVGAVPRGLRDMRFVGELLDGRAVTTDEAGRYRLENLPPGEVDVVAVAPGHLPGNARALRVGEGGNIAAADIELETGPTVSGRVIDSEGEPIPDVQLRWNTFDPRSLGRRGLDISFAPFLAQAVGEFEYPRTDVDGRFVAGPFPGDPPHRIEFYKAGFRGARHRWDPAEEETIEVVMRRGGAIEGVVMDLERAEPVTQFTISSTDRIETNVEEPGRFNPFSGGMLIEEPSGRFRLEPVESGTVSVTVRARGYLPTRVDDIEVAEGETRRGVIVKMLAGGAVTGSVEDQDGKPVPGAQVLALAPDGRGFGGRRRRGEGEWDGRRGGRTPESFLRELPPAALAYATSLGLVGELATRTDDEGKFELVGVQPGPALLVAFHPDFVPSASQELEVEAGETVEDAKITMSRGGGLFGRVEDRNGRPLAGSTVIAVAPARFARGGSSNVGGGLYQGRADEEGDYRIEHMSAGGYFVLATRGDEAGNPLSFLSSFDFDLVTVPTGEMLEFDLIDASAGGTRVYGFITNKGEPVAGGSLAAIGYEGDNLLGVDFKLARVRAGGEYEFEGLAPGEYQFELDAAGTRVRLMVDVPDAPEYRLDLAVPEAGIEGLVTEELTGAPVVRAEVLMRPLDQIEPEGLLASFIQSEGQLLRTRTDAEGAFRFERLQPGGYELFVRPRARNEGSSLAPSEPIELELGYQELVRGVEIRLLPALEVTGLVVGPDGEPLAEARVRADARDDPELRSPRARTDAEGRFRLTSLAPGGYTLVATAEGYAEGRLEELELSEGDTPEVRIALVRGVAVDLVVYSASGAAQSGARGRLIWTGAQDDRLAEVEGTFRQLFTGEGATDEDGRMELGRFAPGEYELSVWRGLNQTTRPGIQLDGSADRLELSVTLP